ncbi:MAG: hypothetical protein KME17_22910 [Cyanosarcina radialis HA8281-LM2]|nr:hypothetical protein [Cyanosarcina radialis HA8281-LM2]
MKWTKEGNYPEIGQSSLEDFSCETGVENPWRMKLLTVNLTHINTLRRGCIRRAMATGVELPDALSSGTAPDPGCVATKKQNGIKIFRQLWNISCG